MIKIDQPTSISSSHSGVAFSRANKKHLIRCDLNNFDEINTIIRDLQVDIFHRFSLVNHLCSLMLLFIVLLNVSRIILKRIRKVLCVSMSKLRVISLKRRVNRFRYRFIRRGIVRSSEGKDLFYSHFYGLCFRWEESSVQGR